MLEMNTFASSDFFLLGGRAEKAIKFEAELIGFDGSLIGRSRHLPKVQTPQTAQCTSTSCTSL
jgi:hypothetical protein